MRISLIVSTYNWPRALELTLRGIARQSRPPDEVLIADDGSGAPTCALLATLARDFPVPLRHVWQDDDGYRLARIRNLAIAAARGDYVILLDGDTVPGRDFVADHERFARVGCFAQGSRVLTGQHAGARLLASGALDVRFFAADIERRRHTLRLLVLARLYARPHRKAPGVKGCNMAFWRDDLIALNGFNEAMVGWGREDNEIVARAYHLGLRRRDLRFAALGVHLWHATRKNLVDNPNDAILADSRARGLIRCERGLDQHLAAFAAAPPSDLRKQD
ncbi:MAG: glycosyltransferase family 2 protein [Dokdonella sp.]